MSDPPRPSLPPSTPWAVEVEPPARISTPRVDVDAPASITPSTRASSPRISRPLPPHEDTTPVLGTQAPPADTRPMAWSETVDRGLDTLTRRGLRAAIGYWIYHLQATGHLETDALLGLVGCAVGVEAVVRAWRERRATAAAAVALPLTLAALGELARFAPLTHAAGYLTAAVTAVGSLRRP